jgi:hypothetical protein
MSARSIHRGRSGFVSLWLLFCGGASMFACSPAEQGRRASSEPASTSPVSLARVEPSYLNVVRWRSIGPSRGGRVIAVSGDPVSKQVFYFGGVGGGVWKTDDGGVTWRNISDGYFTTSAIGAIDMLTND